VVNAHSGQARRARYALHAFTPGDTMVTSFDRYEGRVLTRVESIEQRRVLWSHGEEQLWAAHLTRYQIDLWDLESMRVRSLVQAVDWFPPTPYVPAPARLAPPPARIRGIYEDPEGLLWVIISLADSEWHGYDLPPNDGMGRGPNGRYVGSNRHLENSVYDTLIEVIDPRRAVVVARQRVDPALSGFIGPGYVTEYGSTGNDVGTYYVLRLSLDRESGRG
jgi:hypothetical protein